MIAITNKVKVTFNPNVKVLLLLGSNNPHHDTMSSAYPSVTFSCLLKIQCYFAQNNDHHNDMMSGCCPQD